MDVGKFKASRGRLVAWVAIPPLLFSSIGLGAHAWRLRSELRLNQTTALVDILPQFIESQREAKELIGELVLDGQDKIGSEDQLISFLQEVALRRGFTVDAVQVVRRELIGGKGVPVLNAVVEGTGHFVSIQLYINEIKSAQQLLSVNSITLDQPRQQELEGLFEAKIVFDLLLLDEVLNAEGGAQ